MTERISPESPLAPPPARNAEPAAKRGRLRVFLGIGPGAGKTAAMLQAALTEKLAGRQVVIAAVRTRGLRQVEALAERLPWVRRQRRMPGADGGGELDLDETLARRPDIAIVDELARSNPPGSRHARRHQDALELLEAGIDVYTTLNVYEIASRTELLQPAAGASSAGTVPDNIVDDASIELVDTAPAELIHRLRHGNVRLPEGCGLGRTRFFELGNLLALREMAARLFAERVAKDAQDHRRASHTAGPAGSGHRVLVTVEAGWDSEQIILWTRRLAGSLNAAWVVLYVETSRGAGLEEESRLTRNLELARELGAEVITTVDEDAAGATLRVAASRNITQIVVGTTESRGWRRFLQPGSTVSRLIRESREIGVHVVPVRQGKRSKAARRRTTGSGWAQYLATVAVIGTVTLAGFVFTPLVGAHATALLFLLATVILALFVDRKAALLAAVMSAIIWDYFFLPPVFAFRVSHLEDAMLLGMYFVVALALGQLTARIRAQEAGERQREGRATALYLLTRELAEAATTDQIVRAVVEGLERTFDAQVAALLPDASGRLQAHASSSLTLGQKELTAAEWALEHRQSAGKFTETLPMVDTIFIPLWSGASGALGVLGLRLRQSVPPTIHQQNLLDALTRQIALALDRQRLSGLSEKAKVLAESERLGETLLNSMSHEIRTPLAAIKTAASDLAELRSVSAPGPALIAEIQEAAERLNRLVGKVLDITRLESGHIKPLFNECEVNDIINLAVAETEKDLARHKVTVDIASGLPIVRTDFVFLQQALMNLLSNAAFHTPAGTAVEVRAWMKGENLLISVADRGSGIASESLPRVFDKFYRGPAAPTGGTGLGLSLVKGFVEAVGGKVMAENRLGGGAEFTIALPAPETEPRPTVAI